MNDCWAKSLGGCTGGISGEHIVSNGLFDDLVDVNGFSWCKNDWKTIGISRLTRKCLCKAHNSELSPVDAAAIQAFETFRKQTEMSNERGKHPDRIYETVTLSIDASALERWLLKTLINISFGGEHYVGYDSVAVGWPCSHLVRAAFGRDKFREHNGMRVAYKEGGLLHSQDRIQYAPIIKDGKYVFGGRFSFRGTLLFLDISPSGIDTPFEQIPGMQEEWKNVFLSKKFKQIKATHNGRLSHVINFEWE
jgi:hypothetical protein